jgi:hypothetical protein
MTAKHDLERRIADFYATEAPTRAPDWLLGSALETIDNTPQRRVLIRVPWRLETMNSTVKLALAAVAVIVIGVVGLSVLRPGPGPGVGGQGTTPSPTLSPTPSPTLAPTSSSSSLPALTETFTSTIHGISVGYPAGWKLQPATEPWRTGIVQQDSPYADVIYEKETDTPFIAVASQPLAGKTLDRWANDNLAGEPCGTLEPVTVDGASGLLADCNDDPAGLGALAFVSAGGRGYLVWLYRIDDRDWYNQILATVKLEPQDAVDASPSASPSGG